MLYIYPCRILIQLIQILPHTSSTTNTSARHLDPNRSARIWAVSWPAGSAVGIAASVMIQYTTASLAARHHHRRLVLNIVLHLVLQPATHVLHQPLDDGVGLERPEVEQVELEPEHEFPGRLLIKCMYFCSNCPGRTCRWAGAGALWQAGGRATRHHRHHPG